MNTYEVDLFLCCTYTIEAEDEDEAKSRAYEMLSECEPDWTVTCLNDEEREG